MSFSTNISTLSTALNRSIRRYVTFFTSFIKQLHKRFIERSLFKKVGNTHPLFLLPNCIFKRVILEPVQTKYGFKIYVNPLDSIVSQQIKESGVWADTEAYLLQQQLKKGDVVADLGANIGYMTLLASKLVGKKGKVYAFEPDKENFALLKKSVSLNHATNVVLNNVAVGDVVGKIKLFINEENKGDHRVFDSGDGRKSVEVATTSLDAYFAPMRHKVDFIKMDIQGFEEKAYVGMRKILEKNRNIKIVFEFWPYGLKLAGSNPKKILSLLHGYGFKLFDVDEYTVKFAPIPNRNFDRYIKHLIPGEMSSNIFLGRTITAVS